MKIAPSACQKQAEGQPNALPTPLSPNQITLSDINRAI